MRDFLAARTKTESGARIQARPLYDAYVSWCRAYNRPVLALTRFGRAITAAGVQKATGAGSAISTSHSSPDGRMAFC